jgi:hypothetical protein
MELEALLVASSSTSCSAERFANELAKGTATPCLDFVDGSIITISQMIPMPEKC